MVIGSFSLWFRENASGKAYYKSFSKCRFVNSFNFVLHLNLNNDPFGLRETYC